MAGSRDGLALPKVQLPIGSTQPAKLAEWIDRSQLNGKAHLLVVSLGVKSGRHASSVTH
jgi:hypothetical protein